MSEQSTYDELLAETQAVNEHDGTHAFDEDPDVEVVDTDEDVEEVDEPAVAEGKAEASKTTKAAQKKANARGDLPEGYVTPVGLAKLVNENKLHTNRDGEVVDCPPQVVYSYIKNAPKDHPFPLEEILDSNGQKRAVVKIDAGLAWWREKNERTAERRKNAAEKARKQLEAAEKKAAGTTTDTAPVAVEEAEDAVEAE